MESTPQDPDPEGTAGGSRTPPDHGDIAQNSGNFDKSLGDLRRSSSPVQEPEGVSGPRPGSPMNPATPTKSQNADEPKTSNKSVEAAPPPKPAAQRSDPAPVLNPGISDKPKFVIKRKRSQFGRRRKKKSRTRLAWDEQQQQQQQGEDPNEQGEGYVNPDPGPEQAGEVGEDLQQEGGVGEVLEGDPPEEGEGQEGDPAEDGSDSHASGAKGGDELNAEPGGDGSFGGAVRTKTGRLSQSDLSAKVNFAAAAGQRKDGQIRRLREERKALVATLRSTTRSLERKTRALERSASLAEAERSRAKKQKEENITLTKKSASLRSNVTAMRAEIKRMSRKANRDKKVVRKILIAKDEEVESSLRKIDATKATAIARAQEKQEDATKRALQAESALFVAKQTAKEEKTALLAKMDKERQGQEAVVMTLRKRLSQQNQSAKVLKQKVAEKQKEVSAGKRTLKRKVLQHEDDLRMTERLRKRLELKDKELHRDRVANEER